MRGAHGGEALSWAELTRNVGKTRSTPDPAPGIKSQKITSGALHGKIPGTTGEGPLRGKSAVRVVET